MKLTDYVKSLDKKSTKLKNDIEEDVTLFNQPSQQVELKQPPQGSSLKLTDFVKQNNINLGPKPEQIDPSTGEMYPYFADGSSSSTALNKSNLDAGDRLVMQTGNLKGNVEYLKNKYEDATLDKKGNIKVKQDGIWYEADPKGLGSGSAWDKTRELLKDVVDLSDEAALTAATIAAAAATGGSSLAVQAGAMGAGAGLSEFSRTSLGRVAGTYEATAVEQLSDVAMEAILTGATGYIIPAGTKLVGKHMGNLLRRTKEQLTKLGPGKMKEAFYKKAAEASGLTDDLIKHGIDNVDDVARTLNELDKLDDATVPLFIKEKSANTYGEWLLSVKPAINKFMDVNKAAIKKQVKPNFSYNLEGAKSSFLNNYKNMGLLDKNNKVVNKEAFKQALDDAGMYDVAAIIDDTNFYNEISKVFNRVTKQGKSKQGKAAIDEIFADLHTVSEMTYKLGQRAARIPEKGDAAKKFMSSINKNFNESMGFYLRKNGDDAAVNLLEQTRQRYGYLKDLTEPFRKVADNYKKFPNSVERFRALDTEVNRFLANNQTNRQGFFREIAEVNKELGDLPGVKLTEKMNEIKNLVAASAFHPKAANSSIMDTGVAYSISTATMGALLPAPFNIAAGIGGGSVIQSTMKKLASPRSVFNHFSKQTQQSGVKSGFDLLNKTRVMSQSPQGKALGPVLVNQWMDSLQTQEQTQQVLNQQIQQSTGQQ